MGYSVTDFANYNVSEWVMVSKRLLYLRFVSQIYEDLKSFEKEGVLFNELLIIPWFILLYYLASNHHVIMESWHYFRVILNLL